MEKLILLTGAIAILLLIFMKFKIIAGAFRVSFIWGLLVLFIPPFALLYVLGQGDHSKAFRWTYVSCIALVLLSAITMHQRELRMQAEREAAELSDNEYANAELDR